MAREPIRLFGDFHVVATTVTVNGIEITSKADWDKVIASVDELRRENERLLAGLKDIAEGCDDAQDVAHLILHHNYPNKDSVTPTEI